MSLSKPAQLPAAAELNIFPLGFFQTAAVYTHELQTMSGESVARTPSLIALCTHAPCTRMIVHVRRVQACWKSSLWFRRGPAPEQGVQGRGRGALSAPSTRPHRENTRHRLNGTLRRICTWEPPGKARLMSNSTGSDICVHTFSSSGATSGKLLSLQCMCVSSFSLFVCV